jgi:hypothetical protein
MDMRKIITAVSVKIRGNELPITSFIEDIDNTTKSVNFEVSKSLYKKFEYVVGKGNVSETIRRFMKAVVRKYEKLSDPSPSNFLKEVERAGKRQKERKEQRDRE